MKPRESLISGRDAKGQKLKMDMKHGAVIKYSPVSGEVLLSKEAQLEAGAGQPHLMAAPGAPEVSSPELTSQQPGLQVEPCGG